MFVAFAFAILFAGQIDKKELLYIAFFSIITLTIIFAALKRKHLPQLALILLAFILGIGSFFATNSKYKNLIHYSGEVVLEGSAEYVRDYSTSQSVVLKVKKINEEKANFSVNVYISQAAVKLGDKITLKAKLTPEKLFNLGKFSSFNYTNNIFYSTSITNDDIIETQDTKPSLKTIIKNHTLNLFLENMPEETAYVNYGAMFGDVENISSQTYSSFSKSGIIHILSVSGMHIAIIVGLINAFLKRVKMPRKARLVFFVIALGFYCYLCSFNVTVVRAALMSLALLFGSGFGKQYDTLSAIGFSGLAILIFAPFSVYEIGFQLSFISVLMIALLTKPITKFFLSLHFPKKLATAISVSISVQIGLLPLLLKYFNSVQIYSTLTNLIAVPVFEAGFVVSFVLNFSVIIFPFLKFLFVISSTLINLTISISNYFASHKYATISLPQISDFGIVLFLVMLFVISGFFMTKKRTKVLISAILITTSFVFGVFNSLPKNYNELTVFQINHYYTQSHIIASNNKFTLISDYSQIDNIYDYLNQAKIKKLDVLVKQCASVDEENFENIKLKFPEAQIVEFEQEFKGQNFSIKFENIFPDIKLLLLESKGYKALFINQKLTNFQLQQANYLIKEKNINLLVFGASYTQHNSLLETDFYIYNTALKTPNNYYINLKNWLFKIKNGKLSTLRSLDWNFLTLRKT